MNDLIQRITQAANARFFPKEVIQTPVQIVPPSPFKREKSQPVESLSENKQKKNKKVKAHKSSKKEHTSESSKKEPASEKKESSSDAIKHEPRSEAAPKLPPKQPVPGYGLTKPNPPVNPPNHDPVLDPDVNDLENNSETKSDSEPAIINTQTPLLKTRVAKLRKDFSSKPLGDQNSSGVTSSPASFLTPVSPRSEPQMKKSTPLSESEVNIIDCGGGGECQLLSLFKGLEIQYPDLLRKHSIKTALDLRRMGVNFVKDQIENYGKYRARVIAYLDSDRKEYNLFEEATLKRQSQEEKAKLERDFKAKKINFANYDEQMSAWRIKDHQLMDDFKNNIEIQDDQDEEFLNCLEQEGFPCSTLHLFSLSVLLGIPIKVRDEKGVGQHDTQLFNPLESTLAPIHLYRVKRSHYQLMLYTKSS